MRRAVRLVRPFMGILLFSALFLGANPASAQEQPVKPYVMLLFDTSGSMAWTTCRSGGCSGTSCETYFGEVYGDNSIDCPGNAVSCNTCNGFGCGNGQTDDTRLWKVKKGASSVIASFGEVTFGLARFHQTPIDFSCQPYPDTTNFGVGGWLGASSSAVCNADAMGTGTNQADLLVGFSDGNQNDLLMWMNGCDDYPSKGDCPQTAAPATGCSLCDDCGGGCDHELRASWQTPIAGSLHDLRVNYLPAILAADPKKDCRPYKIILLTDGQDSCAGDPDTEAGNLYTNAGKSIPVHVVGFATPQLKSTLDDIANAGGTGQAIIVDDEVSLALAMATVVSESLLSESCNGIDDDCDGLCDESWPEVAVTDPDCTNLRSAQTCTVGQGICQRTGVYLCSGDGSKAVCSATAGPANPGDICGNGLDDDCDGVIDENCPGDICQVEICDGKDNDCDGLIDEDYLSVPCGSDIGECKKGTTSCVQGKVICNGESGPEQELCDAKDNNCDTVIDQFYQSCFPFASGCDIAQKTCKGICQIGIELCTAGSFGACTGAVGPASESCNGLDDNCNGQVDEGVGNTCTDYTTCAPYHSCAACPLGPDEVCDGNDNDCNGKIDDNPQGTGQACGTNVGECQQGTMQCVGGKLDCVGEVKPTAEICDGKDNDCNSKIDDGVTQGAPCGTDEGECKKGVTQCVAGGYICQGEIGPATEICDGKDNNCDGQIDETAECPAGTQCVGGQCLLPCAKSEFPCPGGFDCINDYCLPNTCSGQKCKSSETCVDGKCVNKCALANCESYETCDANTGVCEDASCYGQGCPAGEVCVDFNCLADPCPAGTCEDFQVCADGNCYETCLNVQCSSGFRCERGACVADDCSGFTCADNHICQIADGKGSCQPDPCRLVSCGKGKVCYLGNCVLDPCPTTACPQGMVCQIGPTGISDCVVENPDALPQTTEILATGAGGLSCTIGDSDAGSDHGILAWLFTILALMTIRRRPRG